MITEVTGTDMIFAVCVYTCHFIERTHGDLLSQFAKVSTHALFSSTDSVILSKSCFVFKVYGTTSHFINMVALIFRYACTRNYEKTAMMPILLSRDDVLSFTLYYVDQRVHIFQALTCALLPQKS
jgi:hypothetical protein